MNTYLYGTIWYSVVATFPAKDGVEISGESRHSKTR